MLWLLRMPGDLQGPLVHLHPFGSGPTQPGPPSLHTRVRTSKLGPTFLSSLTSPHSVHTAPQTKYDMHPHMCTCAHTCMHAHCNMLLHPGAPCACPHMHSCHLSHSPTRPAGCPSVCTHPSLPMICTHPQLLVPNHLAVPSQQPSCSPRHQESCLPRPRGLRTRHRAQHPNSGL